MEKTQAQEKVEAWMRVANLCEQALAVLVAVNEGPMQQATLMQLEETARVQMKLWL